MTIERLKFIEDEERRTLRAESKDLLSFMIKTQGSNAAETLSEISVMHGAVIKAAAEEGLDLEKFYLDFFKELPSGDGLDEYRAFVAEYLNDISDEEFPFEMLSRMFKDCLRMECYREGLFGDKE